jgi:hypothetical protein
MVLPTTEFPVVHLSSNANSPRRTTSPDQAIGDLLRAQASYGLRDPGLVAVTNATGFGRSATATAKSSGIKLISRTELERWPFMLD